MMYFYTFCNRECPITYIAKRISNSSQEKYPEMVAIGIKDKTSDIFFMTTTVGYIGTLTYVIYRGSFIFVLLLSHLLPIYFICPKDDSIFIPVQGLTQFILAFSFSLLVLQQFSRDWQHSVEN